MEGGAFFYLSVNSVVLIWGVEVIRGNMVHLYVMIPKTLCSKLLQSVTDKD